MKFSSSKFLPAQQGDLDGFCGVCSVMNFYFRRLGWKAGDKRRQKLFERFLGHLHEREKFTVQRVARTGFRRGQIQAAFGKLAQDQGVAVKAVSLSTFAKKHGAIDIFSVLTRLGADEAAMVHLDSCDHWVLAHSLNENKFVVDDSSREYEPLTYGVGEVAKYEVGIKEGLVFLNA